ncbi:hypothetical protein EI555_006831, partial [Monodon monoceros]
NRSWSPWKSCIVLGPAPLLRTRMGRALAWGGRGPGRCDGRKEERAEQHMRWVSMATGRGRQLQPPWRGLMARPPPLGGDGSARGRAGKAAGGLGFRTGRGVRLVAGCAALGHRARLDELCGKSCTGCSVSLDGLPSEILLKILSYLDAVALLCAGCVNRRFYHLANDNFIWIRIYSTAFSPKRSNWKVNSVEKTAVSMNSLSVGDKEAGYWKKEYITKQIASVKAALARVLKPLHPYTGLPVKTKEALRISGLGWVIILKENSGKEHILEHVDLSFNDSSVTAMWYGKDWPRLVTLSTLDLCGVTPVFLNRSQTPMKNGPYELPPHTPLSDDSPECGLSGYQLHVDMHSGGVFCLCGTFRNLSTSKGPVSSPSRMRVKAASPLSCTVFITLMEAETQTGADRGGKGHQSRGGKEGMQCALLWFL